MTDILSFGITDYRVNFFIVCLRTSQVWPVYVGDSALLPCLVMFMVHTMLWSIKKFELVFLHQELISYCYWSCSCWGDAVQKSPMLHHFKLDRDEIWQDCSSSKCALIISRVGAGIISHRKCCHLVNGDAHAAQCLCSSVRQFLIYSTIMFAVLTHLCILRFTAEEAGIKCTT